MWRILTMAAALIGLSGAGQGIAAEHSVGGHRACLSKAEQQAAISRGQAVTLAAAIRAVRGRGRHVPARNAREVLRAKLCREGDGLVYLLTVLTRSGKVRHIKVDAASGRVMRAR